MASITRPSNRHPAYWAFVVHRVSGLALTLFLPAHFLVLGLALRGEATLDGFLRWSDRPLVKAAETILVLLLAAHLAGGLRLLVIELLPWSERQRTILAAAAAVTIALGLGFALNVA